VVSHYNPPHSDWFDGIIVGLLDRFIGFAWYRQCESLSWFKTDDATTGMRVSGRGLHFA